MRDVISHNSVTPRQGLCKDTLLVDHRRRNPIYFEFNDPLNRLAREQLSDAISILTDFFLAVGIIDLEHRYPVLNRLEVLNRLFADTLRGALGRL